MRIGFDLDKIFIDYPPFVPDLLIDWLFKDHTKKELAYRFPGRFEQKIRRLSHYSLLRPPIKENIAFIQKLAKEDKHRLYLVSGRFSFLKDITSCLLGKYGLIKPFAQREFNFSNKQPHFFKEGVIKKHHFDIYIDDDLPLLRFLEQKNLKTQLFWLNKRGSSIKNRRIKTIRNLAELQKLKIL